RHPHLRGHRRRPRHAGRRAGGRRCLRREPDRHRHPLPPHPPRRRLARGIPLGPGKKTRTAGEGGRTMNGPTPANLLPFDGVARHLGTVLPADDATKYYDHLISSVPWSRDEVVMFGKRVVTAREVAWFGDAGLSYTYSGSTKQ